jgi:hypothetical protein
LQASLDLGAKQLQAAADEISRLIAAPVSEAGATPLIASIRTRIHQTTTDFHALNTHVGRLNDTERPDQNQGMPSDGKYLSKEVGGIVNASSLFETAVAHAEQFASQHGEKLGTDIHLFKDYLNDMLDKFTIDKQAPTSHEIVSDSEDTLRTEALGLNLTAAYEAARAVRMELAAGPEPTVTSDLIKVKRHIGQIAALLKQVTNPKTLHACQAHVRQVVAEVRELETVLAGKPALEATLKGTNFALDVREIDRKMTGAK